MQQKYHIKFALLNFFSHNRAFNLNRGNNESNITTEKIKKSNKEHAQKEEIMHCSSVFHRFLFFFAEFDEENK